MSLAERTSVERLSLEFPADPAHILTARLFAGGAARSLALEEDAADVLRLALTEICSEAIDGRRGGRIVIEVLADKDPIRVNVVASAARGDDDRTNRTEATYRRALIEALVPDVTFVENSDRLNVTFTLRSE